MKPQFSIVIPVHNEGPHIDPLYTQLAEVMGASYPSFEVIFVDDASTDDSFTRMEQIAGLDERVTAIQLRRNFGKGAALAAGFDHARGEIIISMDGDLHHDPADIPALVKKMEEGYDLVSGRRHARLDSLLTRRVPAAAANWCSRKISGIPIHDFGSGFKAYRRKVIKSVNLYGDLFRFIPALADVNGSRVAEVPIRSPERPADKPRYRLERTFSVLFDLVTVRFLRKYLTRPLHLFGPLGLAAMTAGGGCLAFVLWKKLHGPVFLEHGPLLVMGFVLVLAGLQLITTGLIGELLIRTYFESQKRRIYTVERVLSRKHSQAEAARQAGAG